MDSAADKSLFEITLSPEGANHIFRIYKLVWIILIGIFLIGFITMIHAWIDFFKYRNIESRGNLMFFFQVMFYPFFSTFTTIILLIQNSLYFYFFRNCKKSIETGQSDLFNRSFKWLRISMIYAIIGILLDLGGSAFYLYASLVRI